MIYRLRDSTDWGDPAYRRFVAGILRQWLHCAPRRILGHNRRQIIIGPDFLQATDVIGCSCGQVFWRRHPSSSADHPWLNPAHPIHGMSDSERWREFLRFDAERRRDHSGPSSAEMAEHYQQMTKKVKTALGL